MKISDQVRRTPLLPIGHNIFGKAESLQLGNSYKMRGVANVVANLTPAQLKRGLSTVSAGNLGYALSYAASLLNVPCKIYVPDSAPTVKKENILRHGAILLELPFERIWEMVLLNTNPEPEEIFLHPCFTPNLIEGYACIGNELLVDAPNLDCVVIPYGLGSLFVGVASRLKTLKPEIKLFAAEIEGASPVHRFLHGGRQTFAQSALVDAIGTPELVPAIFERAKPMMADSVIVSAEETLRALQKLLRQGLVVEGAAAVAFAAAEKLSMRYPEKKIACILSGANIDPGKLARLLAG